ncbi:HAMP domain-containing sensor histidine kinase [Halomonas sp. PR-M31]|uniref:sensor histidine kinase n=1 Tax=Halomonas sp. PR-M31 TaxID=1471202 RepID=UPI000A86CE58|nr:HAMP domain-containing sensor histidine kinase [Halomonas sp. PR-M31]
MRAILGPVVHWSLRRRLMVASLVLVLLVLPLAGVGLAYNFRDAVTGSFDQRLSSLLQVILVRLEQDPISRRLDESLDLGDPRFSRVFSGWYWQVTDTRDTTLVSRSLWDQRLPVIQAQGETLRNAQGPRGEPLRIAERDVRLPGYPHRLHVSVAASREELNAEVARFEWLLGLSLLTLGGLLLVGLALQIHWGLAPLRRLHTNLRAIESGERKRLETHLPGELRELAQAMNEVLERDERMLTRSRDAAGNLAHALKTPVSVLKTLADRLPETPRQQVRGEVARIDTAVRHHLSRASAAGSALLSGRVGLKATIAPVVEGLARLAERRGILFEQNIDEAFNVRMDPQDLQELVGNLLENALRWAETWVALKTQAANDGLWLSIDDDGPGMNPQQRERALKRGARLDERHLEADPGFDQSPDTGFDSSPSAGSGLGLAIVEDLVALYGGQLQLEESTLGGLCVRVWLPSKISR